MNEITTIITIQLTTIGRCDDEHLEQALKNSHDQENLRNFEKAVKKALGVDVIKVTGIQDFILEKGGLNG